MFQVNFNNTAIINIDSVKEFYSYTSDNITVPFLRFRINNTDKNLDYFHTILTTKNALDKIIVIDSKGEEIVFEGYTVIATCNRTLLEANLFSVNIELNKMIELQEKEEKKNIAKEEAREDRI